MALSITNNVASLTAQNNLSRTSSALSKSLERLSSGLRINRGADGPAALVISEQQRAQISGLQSAIENTSKAVAVVQTSEGALNEINRLLGKIRGLALDSANAGVNDSNTLAANQSEISNALDTINRISTSTQFGTKKLLDGTNGAVAATNNAKATAFATGTIASGTYQVRNVVAATAATASGAAAANVAVGGETLTINGTQLTLAAGTTQANQILAINNIADKTGVKAVNVGGVTTLYSTSFGKGHTISVSSSVASGSSGLGSGDGVVSVDGVDIKGDINGVAATGIGNTLTANSGTAAGLTVTFAETSAANPYTTDATNTDATVDASRALVFQIGANAGQTASILIDRAHSDSLGKGVSSTFTDLSKISVTDPTKASQVLSVVDKAIDNVSTLRGRLGAFQQNTLESTANNLRASLENTVSAESVIRDTDFAAETAAFTKNQVLIQAGTSVLQNANQTSQLVLGLLRG